VDISRIESGTFAMEKERRDFTGILNETVDSMDCIANNCGVTVERDIKIKSAPVEADKGRLIQAISNILNNAIRYSRKGGSIKVELDHAGTKNMPEKIRAALLEDHVYYSLRVIDRGPGLEKKYMEKIFERFFQVENADTRSHQGAGLGLSVAKSIVEEHGGLIYAESEGPGKGLTICLLMPE
jgi:signal transduction histidine kinase